MNWPNPFDLHASAFPQSTMHSGKLGDSEGLSPPYFDQAGLSILRPPHIHYNAKQGKKKVNVVIHSGQKCLGSWAILPSKIASGEVGV